MAESPATTKRFTITCRRCERPILARTSWIGWEVQCPHCSSQLRVPQPPEDGRPVQADGPHLGPKHVFNFPCPACDCLLEAHTGMPGAVATCPTCAARFKVPNINERTGRPAKAELLETEDQFPTPVHAYGASGLTAPSIVKLADDSLAIQCPHCNAYNPIDADECFECDTPFTMEAAVTSGEITSNRWASSSVTLGVIGVIAFPLFIPSLFAMYLGAKAALAPRTGRQTIVGLIGLFLGFISAAGGVVFWYFKLK